MTDALRRHYPEYLMEAWGLGLFMFLAGVCTVALEFPGSPLRAALPDAGVRRVLMGLAMGLTAVVNIHAPWGKRSGAHLNPATTLAFWSLGRVTGADAVFYALFQTLGGVAGILLAAVLFPARLAAPEVHFAATVPGKWGGGAAFAAEAAISFTLLTVALFLSQSRRGNRYTGLAVGLLVASYIAVEAPVSGMSMNPARTFASAWVAHDWTGFWIYMTAPPAGMLSAALLYAATRGDVAVRCAKLHHDNSYRCIFRCRWGATESRSR